MIFAKYFIIDFQNIFFFIILKSILNYMNISVDIWCYIHYFYIVLCV